MKIKSETDILHERIIFLKSQQTIELKLLKEQLHQTLAELKPINLLKNTIKDVPSSDVKNILIDNAIGLTTGFLSKKILIGSTKNPLKNLFGTIIQYTVGNIISKHPGFVKSAGKNIIDRILKHKPEVTQVFPDEAL